MKKLVLMAMTMMFTLLTLASTVLSDGGPYKEIIGGVEWTFMVTNGQASVGSGGWDLPAIPTSTTGDITTPSTLGGCPVTSIGGWAFYYRSGLTSVKIPSSVTNIGAWAFCNCSGLNSVTIPNSVTNIGEAAFWNCSELTTLAIPSSVMSIGYRAFCGCSALMSFDVDVENPNYKSENGLLLTKDGTTLVAGINGDVKIPNGVTSIGECAFSGYDGLTNVTMPSSVTNVGASAFSLSGLTNVIISGSVTDIGNQAFFSCVHLTNLTIPSSVTNLGDQLVYGSALNVAYFEGAPPNGLVSAFMYSGSSIRYNVEYEKEWLAVLESSWWRPSSAPYVPGSVPLPDGGPYTEVVDGIEWTFMVENGRASVGSNADCTPAIPSETTGEIAIPTMLGGNFVTSIGAYAFYCCSGLARVSIPSRVTGIGDYAFNYCSSLNIADVPSSVTTIGDYAFSGCYQMYGVCIQDGIAHIGDYAFKGCCGIGYLYFSKGEISIGDGAFMGSDVYSLIVTEGVESIDIGDGGFEMCPLSHIEIRAITADIGAYAFFGTLYSGDVDLTLGGKVCIGEGAFSGEYFGAPDEPSMCVQMNKGEIIIGRRAFYERDGLTSVTIDKNVTSVSIGEEAFANCDNLTSVTLSGGVTNIGAKAFYDCDVLPDITIPLSVINIGEASFMYCYGLTNVTVVGGPKTFGPMAFYCSAIVSVRISDLATWCANEFVGQSAHPFGGSVYGEGGKLYVNETEIVDLVIPDGVTSIGAYAFEYCSGLNTLTIPSSVTDIGEDAFMGCDGLNVVKFLGAPPTGFPAGINNDVELQYNAAHMAEWLPVIESYGFKNATPYDPVAPVVSDVVAAQRYPWNGKVDIYFNLSSVKDESRTLAVCATDQDSGLTYTAGQIDGDVFCTKGSHHVVWDMAADDVEISSTNLIFGVSYALMPFCCATGWSMQTNVDLTDGIRKAKKIEFLTYSTEWEDHVDNAVSVITINGDARYGQTGSGTIEWKIMHDGIYELMHTVKTNGVVVGETLSAMFVAEGIGPSSPVIAPVSGTTFDTSLTVSMSCTSDGATIHYTMDGTTPTIESPTYTKKFRIYNRTTMKAKSFFEDGVESLMTTAEYAPGKCENPTILPIDGTAFSHSGQAVSISCNAEHGVLRYTTDGTEPTKESAEYTGPFTIDETTTIKAKVFGDQYFDSAVVTATLTRVWAKVTIPEIAAAETFTGSKNKVTILCATEDAAIYYTLDGSVPTTQSARYEKPFCVSGSCIVKAVAVKDDYLDSDVATRSVAREWSIGETMGKCDHAFATSGDLGFVRTNDLTAALGESMRSGTIENCQTSILSTVVVGPGTLSFKWKTSCEEDYPLHEWDHAEFVLDGVVTNWLDGITDWVTVSQRIEGDGEHAIIWRYVKDTEEKEGEDCLWVSEYSWASDLTETQTTSNPVPYDWLTKKCCDVVDEYDSYESVATQKALNKRFTVEQCYVAGLDPESTTNEFTTSIEMVDGLPVITWRPDLNEGGAKSERAYKIWGSTNLVNGGDCEWPTNALHRFFKVTVEMP